MKKIGPMKTARILALVLTLLMAVPFGLSACGDSDKGDGDGQDPAMNYIGNYVCGRAAILIEAEGEDGMKATVTWGSSAWENSVWTMSGTFYPDTLQFEYHDCVRKDCKYTEDGEVDSEEEVYRGGHGFMTFSDSVPLSLTWQDDQEDMAAGMVFEYADVSEETEETGIANPWSGADSAAAAAEGAGIGDFMIPEGAEIGPGAIDHVTYRYMDGMAEAAVDFPAAQVTVRKGKSDLADAGEGDISGDYNEYANTWTQNIKGLEVTCFGNREGEAAKTIWQIEDGYCYSITAAGLGGDDDYGLSADDLNSLINGIQ